MRFWVVRVFLNDTSAKATRADKGSVTLRCALAEKVASSVCHNLTIYTVFRKKHPLTFSSISP